VGVGHALTLTTTQATTTQATTTQATTTQATTTPATMTRAIGRPGGQLAPEPSLMGISNQTALPSLVGRDPHRVAS